jgi:hypothetical protein
MARMTSVVLATLVAVLVFGGQAAAAPTVIAGSLVASDLDQTGRLIRNARVSGCGTAKPAPGLASSSAVNADDHTLTNASSDTACITVEMLMAGCGPANTTAVVAYLGTYDPADPSTNYLGDSGVSTNTNTSAFSFRVPAGAAYHLVVSEAVSGNSCASYELDVHQAPVATFAEGSGANPAAITPARDAFRTELGGGSTAGANGSFGGLRREVNWDGVPDSLAAPNNLPGDFFNTTSPRGLLLSTAGSALQVSALAGNATGTPIEFGNQEAGNPGRFQTFSGQRLFAPVGSAKATAAFREVGTATPAFTRGFGTVFTNVDATPDSTIRLLDSAGNELGIYTSPPATGPDSLTFVGAAFPDRRVASVEISGSDTGSTVTSSGPGGTVMDDFIYGEPGTFTGPADPAPTDPDPDPEPEPALPDTTAPDTALDKTPKAKVKLKGHKRKAKVSFAFSATEPGSTFECSLDSAVYTACTSPFETKVKKGRHTFAVRAIDVAKNVDDSPSSFSFKVKKKRRP